MLFRLKTIFCFLQAFLMLVSHFSVYDSNFKLWVDKAAMDVTSVSDFSFDTMTAEEAEISAEEKAKCRAWYNENILTTENPAYNFSVGCKSLQNSLSDWDISVGEESAVGAVYRGGKTSVITLKHKNSDLVATVEATIYEDYATCEWTVYIKNNGTENSQKITNFYAADCTLDTGISDVYFNYSSNCEEDDFKVMKSGVCVTPMVFHADGGRTSSYLPYFNIDGSSCGVLATTGWTGQWYASLSQTLCGVKFRAKQEEFSAYLTAGEEVRSPMVSLTFYGTGNPLKGYNMYRAYSTNCLVQENTEQRIYQGAGGGINDVKATLNDIKSNGVAEYIDSFWFDAESWYYDATVEGANWYDNAGNWVADEKKFPNGFVEVSDYLAENGIDTMLWFEPERVKEGTLFYNICSEKGWLIDADNSHDNYMLNLADEDCFNWFCDYMVTFLKENHIDEYRQDFNFTPLDFWQANDTSDRKGITENHYVTNLYRYLDTLLTEIDGMRIDNCASGGRRLDPEMMRRSIPLWRSDYMCGEHDNAYEANQMQRYGLSLILPYSSMGYYWTESEYGYLSAMNSVVEVHWQQAVNDGAYCKDMLRRYVSIREYFLDDYYPLTSAANVESDSWTAMQYGTKTAGLITAYRHADAPETLTVKLSGLDLNATYTLSFPFDDNASSFTATGASLADGLTLTADAAPDAIIIEYTLNG